MTIETPLCLTISNTISFNGRKKEERETFDFLADISGYGKRRHCIKMSSFKSGKYKKYYYEFKILDIESGKYEYEEYKDDLSKKAYEAQKAKWLDIPIKETHRQIVYTTIVEIRYLKP